MNWYITSIAAIIFFSAANALARLFQDKIHPLYALVPQIIGAFLSAGIVAVGFKLLSPKSGAFTTQGVTLAIIAGVVWAVGQIFFYVTLSKDAPLSVVIPLVVGGVGVGGVLAGVMFFSEQLSFLRFTGISIVLIGSLILARS